MQLLELAAISPVAHPDGATVGRSIRSVATEHLANLAELLSRVQGETLEQVIATLLAAHAAGRRVYVMGNGGSSSTASHFVCDLVKTAHVPGVQSLRVFSLTDNTPLLTAWSNDAAYECAFAELVTALVDPGDVVIAISASGNSPNVVAGLRAAVARGARTIGLVGFDGGAAGDLVDVAVHVTSHDYGLVEDAHSAITHAIATTVGQVLRAEAVSGTGNGKETGSGHHVLVTAANGRSNGHAVVAKHHPTGAGRA